LEAEIQVGFPDRPPRGDATTGAAPFADAALAGRIRAEARRLGFDAIGFARAEAHPDGQRLLAWLGEGRHGTMRWMARDPVRRADPRAVLTAARTVISVAIGYYQGDWPGAAGRTPLRGRIARYAWGRDYHKRIRKRLLALIQAIRAVSPSARVIPYVDTGPVLDRAWAERAGIGWVGKNTNVILKRSGSWHFLGELLTDLELPPDEPSKSYCGTCARCIAACPTGAIVGPHQLDARRCISYLTIEHGGAIPLDLRPAIGTRIFGCDDCQEVCPWNRFATPTSNPDFAARPEQQTPELLPLLALDGAAFSARFQGTALMRAGRNRFVRNVAVALGNLADPSAVPELRRALLEDADRCVRSHAAWALGRIAGRLAVEALREAAARERDAEALAEIEYALGAATAGGPAPPDPTPRRPSE
jgi:epoxyqueuosine reductase